METDIFVQLLSECGQELFMISYRILKNHYDAEDVMSNTVMKAFEKRDTLHNRSKFKAWIIQILINEARQFIRKQGRVVVTAYPYRGIEAAVSDGYRELWDLVCSLQQDLRDVIILYYYQGFSTKEIAEILHKPKGTVLSRLSRAREILRKML